MVGFAVSSYRDNGLSGLVSQGLGTSMLQMPNIIKNPIISQVLLAQRVQIMTDQGPVIGVIGSIPPHLLEEAQRAKPMALKNMYIDIGADDKEDAINIGIKPGQQIVPICPFTPMANEKVEKYGKWQQVIVIFNASEYERKVPIEPQKWQVVVDDQVASLIPLYTFDGNEIKIKPVSTFVCVR